MESDSDDYSDSESSADPQLILVEDRATRSQWVPATAEEREAVVKALATVARLPTPRAGVDASFKPDFLATMPTFRVMRVRYIGNDYLWLREDASRIERRVLVFPEHEGSMPWTHHALPKQKALPLDRDAKLTWARLGLPESHLERVRRESGDFFVQGRDPNTWTLATGELADAIARGVAAIEAQHDQPPDKVVHLVTIPKQKGTAAFQVFRAPDHSLWIADVNKGHPSEKYVLRFIVAGAHRPART